MGLNLSLYSPPFPPLVGLSAAHSGALDLAAPLPGVIPSAGGSGSGLSTGLSTSSLPDPSPAWLAELLCVTPTPATAPLVLASALPPIPGRAVKKISKAQFIDFKELLNDNVALVSQLRKLGAVASSTSSWSCLCEVTDPLTWVYCYLSFMAVLSPDARVRDLVAYAQIIIQLAWRKRLAGVQSMVPPATGRQDASQVERDKPLAALSDCPGHTPIPEWTQLPPMLVVGPHQD